MLEKIGVSSRAELIEKTVPESILKTDPMDLPHGVSEPEALREIEQLADQNQIATGFIGQGYYGCITPPVVQRLILENPGWYTAYTPYQAEISQGRLEMLLNFQQMVCDLTAMPVANASLLDEGTAAAEAMSMAKRAQRKN
ncbi:MAG: glycine dehydrogenase (aminomethyl-transferring), partial [Porticoccaceae bacterium]|nr:glycine dehydrogenase (aminomethyl-transferring) [Porticoccaceae bacterium]